MKQREIRIGFFVFCGNMKKAFPSVAKGMPVQEVISAIMIFLRQVRKYVQRPVAGIGDSIFDKVLNLLCCSRNTLRAAI